MASCVFQAQVAHRSHLGPSRLSADGVSGALAPCPAAGKTCCKTNMVRAYLVDKEHEMKRLFAVVRRPVICLLIIMGGVLMISTACAAQDADRFFPPLPLSLEVGDRWTYSIVKIRKEGGIIDLLSIETLTIRVIEHLQIEDQTYFALSDGGLYRVDEASRTWRYDTEAKSEKIIWDLWGPKISLSYAVGEKSVIERAVVDGYACQCISRYGPFELRPIPKPGYEGIYTWIQTVEVDSVQYDSYLTNFFHRPLTLSRADLLKLPDLGVTELFGFGRLGIYDTGYDFDLVLAPNVGVVYYAFTEYIFGEFTEDNDTPVEADATGAGKVGHAGDAPGPLEAIEKTEWILRDMQKGDLGSTVIEDISFGQLKQRMTRPSPNAQ